MIDIFNEMYTLLVNALLTSNPNIGTSSVYTNMPSKYPFVSMEEIDNSVYEDTSDCCHVENHVSIEYEINVYTQGTTRKSDGNAIANVVDTLLTQYGFVRQSKNSLQSEDETKYRIIMRYYGIVSKDHVIYRR